MLKAILKLLSIFLTYTLIFVVGKFIFLAANHAIYSDISLSSVCGIIIHGFSMDLSMAGYLSVIPAVILWCSLWIGTKGIIEKILNYYFAFTSLLVSLIIITDAGLYGYWHFKLDSTPLFYFFTSPSSALASVEWWQYIVFPIAWLLYSSLAFIALYLASSRITPPVIPIRGKKFALNLFATIAVSALLFIPIRGGVTVSTMNLSRAYHSSDTRLNHAAVNPAFSLMHSLTHQDKFDKQFRYLSEEENIKLFSELCDAPVDTVSVSLLSNKRPDIYIIILESFSSHLFPTLGGEPIALKLDSIATNGLLLSNMYANSFRTDRGIPSILSAYPGQPTTSIMKYVDKTENLPSLSGLLKDKSGYTNTYYYGGDANFTNMKAYLVSASFDRIISDSDFPVSQKLSKWGAHDEVVFAKVISELTPYTSESPVLKVIQTSSSHEPFEVPYDDKGRIPDPRAKAFAYADSCAASFVDTLHKLPQWHNSLVILVADHYGAYPELSNPIDRHKIPVILTGGALEMKGNVATIGSQIDLVATLAEAMDLPHADFRFSKNLFNDKSPHFAFFADPDKIGFITEQDTTVFNLDSQKIEIGDERLLPYAKSFLQTLYDDLSKR